MTHAVLAYGGSLVDRLEYLVSGRRARMWYLALISVEEWQYVQTHSAIQWQMATFAWAGGAAAQETAGVIARVLFVPHTQADLERQWHVSFHARERAIASGAQALIEGPSPVERCLGWAERTPQGERICQQ